MERSSDEAVKPARRRQGHARQIFSIPKHPGRRKAVWTERNEPSRRHNALLPTGFHRTFMIEIRCRTTVSGTTPRPWTRHEPVSIQEEHREYHCHRRCSSRACRCAGAVLPPQVEERRKHVQTAGKLTGPYAGAGGASRPVTGPRRGRSALHVRADDLPPLQNLLYVDEFNGRDRSDLMDKVRSYNPRGSFPTIVLPGGKVVVGFREQLLREALFHDSAVIAESSQGNS